MRSSALLTAAALGLSLVLGAAAPVQAQSKEDKALAKAQFAEGQRAFKRDDFDEALRHFRRAFELHSHDAVRFNIFWSACIASARPRPSMKRRPRASSSPKRSASARPPRWTRCAPNWARWK